MGGDQPNDGPDDAASSVDQLFEEFCKASSFQSIVFAFNGLCDRLELFPGDHRHFYSHLKRLITSWQARELWKRFDSKLKQPVYAEAREKCQSLRVLIIGAGPCGLRFAIEAALLGCRVVVVEKRSQFSRNNVIHLWRYLIKDLQLLGGKQLYPRMCAGSIDHISIRQLQVMLLKVALLLGVEVHAGVEFLGMVPPTRGAAETPADGQQSSPTEPNETMGWRAKVLRFRPGEADQPATDPFHVINRYEFDVLIGADGRRNTIEGFERRQQRHKLAIAITANFINYGTREELEVEEISGLSQIYRQDYFKEMRETIDLDLENIVYYKDETHYFVMTAKKANLLSRGVLIEDNPESSQLLSPQNVNQEALMEYARDAARYATNDQLPPLQFAYNHYGLPDVAMFDFTACYQAEHSCQLREQDGRRLLIALVGDSLLEPFWPMGTGCGRGFLSVFDAAWMLRQFALGRQTVLDVLAERESIYQMLSYTGPDNILRDVAGYTLDPRTRYVEKGKPMLSQQVQTLVISDSVATIDNSLGAVETSSFFALADDSRLQQMAAESRDRFDSMLFRGFLFRWAILRANRYTKWIKSTLLAVAQKLVDETPNKELSTEPTEGKPHFTMDDFSHLLKTKVFSDQSATLENHMILTPLALCCLLDSLSLLPSNMSLEGLYETLANAEPPPLATSTPLSPLALLGGATYRRPLLVIAETLQRTSRDLSAELSPRHDQKLFGSPRQTGSAVNRPRFSAGLVSRIQNACGTTKTALWYLNPELVYALLHSLYEHSLHCRLTTGARQSSAAKRTGQADNEPANAVPTPPPHPQSRHRKKSGLGARRRSDHHHHKAKQKRSSSAHRTSAIRDEAEAALAAAKSPPVLPGLAKLRQQELIGKLTATPSTSSQGRKWSKTAMSDQLKELGIPLVQGGLLAQRQQELLEASRSQPTTPQLKPEGIADGIASQKKGQLSGLATRQFVPDREALKEKESELRQVQWKSVATDRKESFDDRPDGAGLPARKVAREEPKEPSRTNVKSLADQLFAPKQPSYQPPTDPVAYRRILLHDRPAKDSEVKSRHAMEINDFCYFCKKSMLPMDTITLHGLYLHKQCLCCDYCDVSLLKQQWRFYTEPRTQLSKFYCLQHYDVKLDRPNIPPSGRTRKIRRSRERPSLPSSTTAAPDRQTSDEPRAQRLSSGSQRTRPSLSSMAATEDGFIGADFGTDHDGVGSSTAASGRQRSNSIVSQVSICSTITTPERVEWEAQTNQRQQELSEEEMNRLNMQLPRQERTKRAGQSATPRKSAAPAKRPPIPSGHSGSAGGQLLSRSRRAKLMASRRKRLAASRNATPMMGPKPDSAGGWLSSSSTSSSANSADEADVGQLMPPPPPVQDDCCVADDESTVSENSESADEVDTEQELATVTALERDQIPQTSEQPLQERPSEVVASSKAAVVAALRPSPSTSTLSDVGGKDGKGLDEASKNDVTSSAPSQAGSCYDNVSGAAGTEKRSVSQSPPAPPKTLSVESAKNRPSMKESTTKSAKEKQRPASMGADADAALSPRASFESSLRDRLNTSAPVNHSHVNSSGSRLFNSPGRKVIQSNRSSFFSAPTSFPVLRPRNSSTADASGQRDWLLAHRQSSVDAPSTSDQPPPGSAGMSVSSRSTPAGEPDPAKFPLAVPQRLTSPIRLSRDADGNITEERAIAVPGGILDVDFIDELLESFSETADAINHELSRSSKETPVADGPAFTGPAVPLADADSSPEDLTGSAEAAPLDGAPWTPPTMEERLRQSYESTKIKAEQRAKRRREQRFSTFPTAPPPPGSTDETSPSDHSAERPRRIELMSSSPAIGSATQLESQDGLDDQPKTTNSSIKCRLNTRPQSCLESSVSTHSATADVSTAALGPDTYTGRPKIGEVPKSHSCDDLIVPATLNPTGASGSPQKQKGSATGNSGTPSSFFGRITARLKSSPKHSLPSTPKESVSKKVKKKISAATNPNSKKSVSISPTKRRVFFRSKSTKSPKTSSSNLQVSPEKTDESVDPVVAATTVTTTADPTTTSPTTTTTTTATNKRSSSVEEAGPLESGPVETAKTPPLAEPETFLQLDDLRRELDFQQDLVYRKKQQLKESLDSTEMVAPTETKERLHVVRCYENQLVLCERVLELQEQLGRLAEAGNVTVQAIDQLMRKRDRTCSLIRDARLSSLQQTLLRSVLAVETEPSVIVLFDSEPILTRMLQQTSIV